MSEKKSVNKAIAADSAIATKAQRTKTAEKAAHELAERKMAELAYAENYRQKLREEKAAKKSAEVKAAEERAAEKREAEAKERRKQMEELLQKEREEMAKRNAKADAVLHSAEPERPAAAEKPAPAKKPEAPAPKAPVKEAPKAPVAAPAVTAPIGSFIPFAPKKKKTAARPAPKFEQPAPVTIVRPVFEPYYNDFTVKAGSPVDCVTLEELFATYQAEEIKPDLNGKDVQKLLDDQKKETMKEMDALYDRFLELFNGQKNDAADYLENAKMIRALTGDLKDSHLDPATLEAVADKLEEIKKDKDEGVTAICESLLSLIRDQKAAFEENIRDIDNIRSMVEVMKENDEKKAEVPAEDETPALPVAEEEPAEAEEEEIPAEETEAPEAEQTEEETPDAVDAPVSLTPEDEDALWVEEDMEKGTFAVIPEDLKGLKRKVAARYIREDLKHLRQDAKDQRKHLRLGKTASDAEKRKATYEKIALCRLMMENYAILLKLAVANRLEVASIEDEMDKEMKLERRLVRKLKANGKRILKPSPKRLIEDILSERNKLAPKELYRKEELNA